MPSKNHYISWSKAALLKRIEALEAECQSLRASVSTAVDALSRENADMKAWLESHESLWELLDALVDGVGVA